MSWDADNVFSESLLEEIPNAMENLEYKETLHSNTTLHTI